MAISSLNNVPVANILTLNGTSFSVIEDWGGAPIPPSPPSLLNIVTGSLFAFWDPTTEGSIGTFVYAGTTYSGAADLSYLYTASDSAVTRSLGVFSGAVFTTFSSGSLNVRVMYVDGAGGDYLGGLHLTRGYLTASATDPAKVNTLLNFTNEFWFRSNGSYLTNGALYSAVYNQGSRTRIADGTGTHWAYAPNVSAGANIGGTFATNTWHHYCVTMANINTTNDRLTIYKDGVRVGQDLTGNYNPTHPQAEFFIGSWNSVSELQRMYVGEVRRYNRELTAAEVLQNYSASKYRYGK